MNPNWTKYIKDQKIIAIDPGKAGGIAVYSIDSKELIDLVEMPETPQDLLNFFKHYQLNSRKNRRTDNRKHWMVYIHIYPSHLMQACELMLYFHQTSYRRNHKKQSY